MAKFKTSREIALDVSYEVNQGDIAKKLHVSRAYLSEFLSGKREVSSAILEALGYEIEPLYRRKATQDRPTARITEEWGNRAAPSISRRSLLKARMPDEVQKNRRLSDAEARAREWPEIVESVEAASIQKPLDPKRL